MFANCLQVATNLRICQPYALMIIKFQYTQMELRMKVYMDSVKMLKSWLPQLLYLAGEPWVSHS